MNIPTLTFTNEDGRYVTLIRCVSFSLLRDRYQPYSVLQAVFRYPYDMGLPQYVRFSLGSLTLHEGFAEHTRIEMRKGDRCLILQSKSYSAALVQNQLAPGMYWDVTLDSLMTVYRLPHMTYERISEPVNYVLVKDHTPMWDAVTAFSYKRSGDFPYVRLPNLLCVTPQSGSGAVQIPADSVTLRQTRSDCAGIISRIDMADIDGTPGAFTQTNPEADARGIVRVRQIPFDRQYLYAPPDALRFRISCGNRRIRSERIVYLGYCGEDLEDRISCGEFSARVSRILITGRDGTVKTEDTCYFDDFCNRSGE